MIGIERYEEAFATLRMLETSSLFSQAKQPFVLLAGSSPVLLSAPHNCEQFREGSVKFSEPDSGVMALLAASKHDLSCAVKLRCDDDDANWDENSTYREAIVSFVKNNGIRFLLDLHQLSPKRPQALILGTGKGANIHERQDLVPMFRKAFESRGIVPFAVDEVFCACYENTVCAWVSKRTGIPCFQLEMNCGWFMKDDPRFDPIAMYSAVSECVSLLAKEVDVT